MKKLFFIAAIAGASLVSCTKNELAPSATEQHEITFASPVVGVQTKVYGSILENYDTDEDFAVWAVYSAEEIDDWGDATTPYFNNITATYGTHGGWGLTPKYYWPAVGYLSFAAMSPAFPEEKKNTITYDAEDGFMITKWSQADTQDKIVDLMYSEPTYSHERATYANTNHDNEDDDDTIFEYNGVDIEFKHALSYLVFYIKTDLQYETTSFRLKGISLDGIYTTGAFTQNGSPHWDVADDSPTGTYVAYSKEEGGRMTINNDAQLVPQERHKEIILLPQTLAKDQQKITIEYDIKTDFSNWIPQSQTVDILNAKVSSWEMGKKYVYTITIGMDEIIFDPAVSDWDTDVNDNDLDDDDVDIEL